MSKGRKSCPKCGTEVGARTAACPKEGCGHVFYQTGTTAATATHPETSAAPIIRSNGRIIRAIHTPGTGYGTNKSKSICPASPSGEWPHTDDEVRTWIRNVIRIGLTHYNLYLPSAIKYMADNGPWPKYLRGQPGRCPENHRVHVLIDEVATAIVEKYRRYEEDDNTTAPYQDDAPPEAEAPLPPPPPKATHCPCGKPLHYSDPELQGKIEEIIAAQGEFVTVNAPSGTYSVSRHFIALHKLKAKELPQLAEQGIAKKV